MSATLVYSKKSGGIILDCGEGTLGQLNRRYGASVSDVSFPKVES